MSDYYPGSTVPLVFNFKDFSGIDTDPTSATIKILNPSGGVVTTLTLTDLTKDATGLYHYYYVLSGNAPTGSWTVKCVYVMNNFPTEIRTRYAVVA